MEGYLRTPLQKNSMISYNRAGPFRRGIVHNLWSKVPAAKQQTTLHENSMESYSLCPFSYVIFFSGMVAHTPVGKLHCKQSCPSHCLAFWPGAAHPPSPVILCVNGCRSAAGSPWWVSNGMVLSPFRGKILWWVVCAHLWEYSLSLFQGNAVLRQDFIFRGMVVHTTAGKLHAKLQPQDQQKFQAIFFSGELIAHTVAGW